METTTALNPHYYFPSPRATSTYQMDPSQATVYRFEALCLDNVTRIENLPGRTLDPPPQNFDPTNRGYFHTENEFNPNSYFDILTHLHMQDGYRLDYIFGEGRCTPFPIIYSRPENGYRIDNIQDFMEFTSEQNESSAYEAMFQYGDNYAEFIVLDGTPESYLQFVLLQFMAADFYNGCSGVDPRMVLCGVNDITRINEYVVQYSENHDYDGAAFPEELFDEVRGMDLAPLVIIHSNNVEVRLSTFTYTFYQGGYSGIIDNRYWYSQDLSHTELDSWGNALVWVEYHGN